MKKIMLATAALVMLGFSQADADGVRGHIRKDGTYVGPHLRTSPDRNPYNNYNFPRNYNPNIGRTALGTQIRIWIVITTEAVHRAGLAVLIFSILIVAR